MRLLVVCAFLNEERHLPTLLETMLEQTRLPDRLLLVDDGSTDGSAQLAESFAQRHDFATYLRRPPRPPERDRLARAGELRAFHWGLDQVDEPYDAVTKLDGDLRLTPRTFEHLEAQLEAEPRLGIVGPYLSARTDDGAIERESCPPHHVRGPLKVYRRACYDEIGPMEEILGWDTSDEIAARMHGWEAHSVEIPSGDPIHLRPVGTGDGRLRGYRRWGTCAWGFGAHPLHVLASTARRMRERPRVLGALNYLAGWAIAGLRRAPRAAPDIRAHGRREQLANIRRTLSR